MPLTFSQLLTNPEAEPGSATSSQAAVAPSVGRADLVNAPGQALPELSSSLDEVGLDCVALDDMMWDELEDLGMDVASDPDM